MDSGAVEVLTVVGARKSFGDLHALDGADLTLRRGECLALLGPNGAGKTTMLRAIAGRVRLDGGKISLLGGLIGSSGGVGRESLGLVPQEVALYPMLTSRENLRAFGAFSGLRGRELTERVRWALDWTSLGDRAREPVKRFSGGMKRRLNIACGVLHRPKVVLLDEPTVGVDPQSRERIWEMLTELRTEGASLLLTTHQLDEAQQVSDRIVIIDHGRIVATGSFEELLRQTVGSRRRVTLVPDDSSAEPVVHSIHDIAEDLPRILAEAGAKGLRIADVHISSPNLQAVFLHLTGRELRE